jgi:tight adherence protein C
MFTETNIIVGLTFIAAFAALMALFLPFMSRDPKEVRMAIVAKRREELGREQRGQLVQNQARWRPSARNNLLRQVLSSLKLENLVSSQSTRQRLIQAGWRSQSAIVTYTGIRLATSVAAAFIALLFLSMQQRYGLTAVHQMFMAGAAGVIGFYFPQLMVTNTIQKRQQAMTPSFPDALDLLTICVEAGSSIEAAFARVTEEISDASAILSQEFGLTSAELAFLGDRQRAYRNFAERTGLPAVRALTTSLIQAETYGTPVAMALRVLSQESRDERMARAEKKAAQLPAQLTVPMILFFLPPLFVIIMGPAVISVLKL